MEASRQPEPVEPEPVQVVRRQPEQEQAQEQPQPELESVVESRLLGSRLQAPEVELVERQAPEAVS